VDPTLVTERNGILLEIDKRAVDKKSMDDLSTLLHSVTAQDF
jgi:hypothetical protein